MKNDSAEKNDISLHDVDSVRAFYKRSSADVVCPRRRGGGRPLDATAELS